MVCQFLQCSQVTQSRIYIRSLSRIIFGHLLSQHFCSSCRKRKSLKMDSNNCSLRGLLLGLASVLPWNHFTRGFSPSLRRKTIFKWPDCQTWRRGTAAVSKVAPIEGHAPTPSWITGWASSVSPLPVPSCGPRLLGASGCPPHVTVLKHLLCRLVFSLSCLQLPLNLFLTLS